MWVQKANKANTKLYMFKFKERQRERKELLPFLKTNYFYAQEIIIHLHIFYRLDGTGGYILLSNTNKEV